MNRTCLSEEGYEPYQLQYDENHEEVTAESDNCVEGKLWFEDKFTYWPGWKTLFENKVEYNCIETNENKD